MSSAIQSCPLNPDPCEEIRQKIDELINRKRTSSRSGTKGLRERWWEQIQGENGPGTPIWETHEQEFRNQQKALRKALENYQSNGCGPPPFNGVWEWATKPAPSPKAWEGSKHEIEVDTTAIATVGVVIIVVGLSVLLLPELMPLMALGAI